MDTFDSAISSTGEPCDGRGNLSTPALLGRWITDSMGTSSPPERESDVTHPATSARRSGRFTVLIVDDDESIAELLADLLEGEGYRAVIAHDGLSALDYARTQRPDMILSDCMMPGLSGTQLALELRRSRATRSISLVLMSSTRPRAQSVANVPFLAKPFEIDDVLNLVEQCCVNPVSTQLYGEG